MDLVRSSLLVAVLGRLRFAVGSWFEGRCCFAVDRGMGMGFVFVAVCKRAVVARGCRRRGEGGSEAGRIFGIVVVPFFWLGCGWGWVGERSVLML